MIAGVSKSSLPKIDFDETTPKSNFILTIAFNLTVSENLGWHDSDASLFLGHGNKITITWLREFARTDTKVREATIDRSAKWKEYSKNCFLPWFPGGNWSAPHVQNYSLVEYARANPSSLRTPPGELLVLSAFHTILDKRVLADGCNRAVAIESDMNQRKRIYPVKVIECYGTQVHAIFPCDL